MANASAGERSVQADSQVAAIKQKITKLQKTKNYRELGRLAGITMVQSHCGWGWRSLTDESTSDDLPYETEAWEAGCYETRLMDDVDEFEAILPDEVLQHLGLK